MNNKKYLNINDKLLGNMSVFDFIISRIQKTKNAEQDITVINKAINIQTIKDVFQKYYAGWCYNKAFFLFSDIDLILYWISLDKKKSTKNYRLRAKCN